MILKLHRAIEKKVLFHHWRDMELYTIANAPPEFPNEPLMYPLRLMMQDRPTRAQIYAYPTQRPAHTLIQLEIEIPAIVAYVLGPKWREQLSELGMLDVPQANWTNDDETAISLRMTRGGGGAFMDHNNMVWWRFGDGFGGRWLPVQQQQKYIFGWPNSGGVWVLLLPPLLERHTDGSYDMAAQWAQVERWHRREKNVFRNVDGSIYFGDLHESESMEELCKSLKGKGAVFYDEFEDSKEVVKSALMHAEMALSKEPIRDGMPVTC